MTKQPVISRRSLLMGLWLAGSSSAWAQVRRGSDQGIGGTGITRGHDQGIGGTGIVGVIQRFGSIFVNGQRISYAPNVPVRIDGEPVSAKALKIGHLARVLALPQANGSLITRGVNVVSEVMGPIESVRDGEMTVLGQRIIAAGHESWRRPGANVAVFGVRRIDGVIVSSLVEQRLNATTRVSGPLERDRGGLRIGGLRLNGADAALVGQRVQAEGRVTQGVMQISRIRADNLSDFFGANRLSIEGYVRRVGSYLQFGSGYVAHDNSRFASSGNARVVVNATFDSSRGLRVESIQSVNKFPGDSIQGTRSEQTPGATPGGSDVPGSGTTVPGGGPPGLGGGGPPGLGGGGPPGLGGGGPPGLGGGGPPGLGGGGPPGLGGGGPPGLGGGSPPGLGGGHGRR
ncbi:hypothetical protein [Bradyrhizobium sp. SZCCHNPS1003]|uniref:hypothetical protein n=1 Tax=Bradyrhizobium sp. SZCCHNPS1003 TaxID=3057330 RepID=UPI0028EF1620|nr:hypothetical protein [Bradyrhizobium sp. SZCCHNPS1003]